MPNNKKNDKEKVNDLAGIKSPNSPQPDFPATYTGPPPLQPYPNQLSESLLRDHQIPN
jgi:hypothetical protein